MCIRASWNRGDFLSGVLSLAIVLVESKDSSDDSCSPNGTDTVEGATVFAR